MKIIKENFSCNILNRNEVQQKTEDKTDDDYITKTIGALGRWHAIYLAIVSLTRFLVFWNLLSVVFLAPKTDFICIAFRNNTLKTAELSKCYDNCLEYHYYLKALKSTLVTEFELICENKWLASFIQTLLMFGLLIGVFLFGWVSDRFGRRKGLISAIAINTLFSLATPFSPNYWTLAAVNIFKGIGSGGLIVTTPVFFVEIMGSKYRELVSACLMISEGIAEATLAIFAYFASGWRSFSLSQAVASIILFVLVLFVPETPRWLLTNGKFELATKSLTKAAKFNKRNTQNIKDVVQNLKDSGIFNVKKDNITYKDLFKTKDNVIKLMLITITFLISAIIYWGIAQYTTYLGHSVYSTVVILGLTQVPLGFVAAYLNKVFGRKKILGVCFFVVGVTMLLLYFTPENSWIRIFLAVIGFMCCCTIISVINLYVLELFPTTLRNMAYGVSSVGAKIGGMIAPFIVNIVPHWIPSLIFAGLAAIPILTLCMLPETKGKTLPDKVQEGNV